MSEIYLTRKRLNELKKELEFLQTVERAKIAKRLEDAKALGDLSENADYIVAKQDKIRLEERISEIKMLIRNAKIIKKPKNNKKVEIGSTIKLQQLNNKNKLIFTLVGSGEANPEKGLISIQSPLGSALLGKAKGEQVEVKTPQRKIIYKIISIS